MNIAANMLQNLDAEDRRLLDHIQASVPLVRRPFEHIGRDCNLTEEDVLARLHRMKHDLGILRMIGGLFDGVRLGYQSLLAGFEVDPDHLEQAAAITGSHPGVSHNYQRNHRYNLWCTVSVPPDSTLGLEGTLSLLADRTHCRSYALFPTIRRYKVRVHFTTGDDAPNADEPASGTPPPDSADSHEDNAFTTTGVFPVSDQHRQAILALQDDLPLVPDAFAQLAAGTAGSCPSESQTPAPDKAFASVRQPVARPADAFRLACARGSDRRVPSPQDVQQPGNAGTPSGIATDTLLQLGEQMLRDGVMRRYAASVRHRELGYTANVMATWNIPPAHMDAVGMNFARHASVSHCYHRQAPADWPHRLFTMIHGTSEQQCRDIVNALLAQAQALTGTTPDVQLLWTMREFKKQRIRYCTDEWHRWEQSICG